MLLDRGVYKGLFQFLHCADKDILNTDPISLKDAYLEFKWAFEIRKKAKHWTEYYEVLHTTAFTLHILCKHCKTTISHRNRNRDKSSSNIRSYLEKYGSYTWYVRQYTKHTLNGLHIYAG